MSGKGSLQPCCSAASLHACGYWLVFTPLMESFMSVTNITGDQTPKLDRIAEYWPSTIQQHWRGLETRHQSLKGKLVSESIRLRGASRPTRQVFAKRRSFVSPPHTLKA